MERFRKFLVIFLIIFILLPGMLQATPVVVEEKQLNVGETYRIKRLAGSNKVETAASVSKEVYEDGAKSVVLVGYNGEIDALTGTLLASVKDAPLLLTRKDDLSQATESEIKRLNPKNIYILGGENVISQKIESELKKDYIVKRIKGNNRAETAIAVAREVEEKTNHVFLVSGYGEKLTDALTIGPVSAREKIPIFLTKEDGIPKETEQALRDLGVTHITIVGGGKAVSLEVERELDKEYIVDRVGGKNREKTAITIAEEYFKTPEGLLIAYGYKDADALLGGYLGSKINAPILLTDKDKLAIETKSYMEENPVNTFVLGGTAVVSEGVFKEIEKILDSIVDDKVEDDSIEQDPDPIPTPKPDPIPTPEPDPELEPEENEDQNAPEGLKSLSLTAQNRDDGKLTGVTDKMEYRLKGEEQFINIEGTELTGLKAGVYEVRFKAKEGHNAGKIVEIIVCSYFESNFDFKDGEIIKYKGSSSEVIIPATILVNGKDVSVTSIGEKIFLNNTGLTSVVIPDTVTSIGKNAFRNCTSLESIIIPDSVENIGERIFQGCSELLSVEIGDKLQDIPPYTFKDCTKLERITIPSSVTQIKDAAFQNCISLQSIVIPDTVTSIGNSGFWNCKLLKSINIPDSVTDLGDRSFYGCEALEEIKLSNYITIIRDQTFSGCTKLGTIIIPNSVTEIKAWTFENCKSLKYIIIPDSVTSISKDVFQGCSVLKFVKVGEGLTLTGKLPYPETSFISTYYENGKQAGTYIYENKVWTKKLELDMD